MYRPNEISTSDPTVNDDFANGFHQGNGWLNTDTDSYFICEDDTTGAAVWTIINTGAAYVWADWTPTFYYVGGTPSAPSSYVARYFTVGNKINFILDIIGSNDSGFTLTAIGATPPVAPKDIDAFIACPSSINESAQTAPTRWVLGLLDAESTLRIYIRSININNGDDYRAVISGFYEIA